MKKILLAIGFLLILAPFSLAKEPTIELDGKVVKTDVAPFIEENRTFVPIRFISEAIGYDVDWDSDDRLVEIENDLKDLKIKLFIGKKEILVNDEKKEIDAAARIKNNRTFVPLRFVAENLGIDVSWDAKDYKVILKNKNKVLNHEDYDLTKEERDYFKSLSKNMNSLKSDMGELKGYLFEKANKFDKAELENRYNEIRSRIEGKISNIESLDVPEKFKESKKYVDMANNELKSLLKDLDLGTISGDREAAKRSVNALNKYQIRAKEAFDSLRAALENKNYIPDKNIDQYNKSLLEDETIKNLFNKIN